MSSQTIPICTMKAQTAVLLLFITLIVVELANARYPVVGLSIKI